MVNELSRFLKIGIYYADFQELAIWWIGIVSLLNNISPFVGYLMPKLSLKNGTGTIYCPPPKKKKHSRGNIRGSYFF